MRTYQIDETRNLALTVEVDATARSRHKYRFDIVSWTDPNRAPYVSGWAFTEAEAIATGRELFDWFIQRRANAGM